MDLDPLLLEGLQGVPPVPPEHFLSSVHPNVLNLLVLSLCLFVVLSPDVTFGFEIFPFFVIYKKIFSSFETVVLFLVIYVVTVFSNVVFIDNFLGTTNYSFTITETDSILKKFKE